MSPRNCLECVHCVSDYEADYSELTPGAGLSLSCLKGHWYDSGVTAYEVRKPALHEALDHAEDCPDFEAEKWAS